MELYIYILFPYSIPLCFHENLTSTSQVKLSPATKPQSPPTPPPPPVKENPREPGELPKPQSAIPGGFADFSDLSDFTWYAYPPEARNLSGHFLDFRGIFKHI